MDQSEEESWPSREELLRDESKALKARRLCNRNADGATGGTYAETSARYDLAYVMPCLDCACDDELYATP